MDVDPAILNRPGPISGIYDLVRADGTTEPRQFADTSAAFAFVIESEPWLEEERQFVQIRENTTGWIIWERGMDDDRDRNNA